MVILDINDRLLKLPRRHLPSKQNIQLAITPPLELWQSEVRGNKTHRLSTAPNVSTLARQVPARRIQHLTSEIDHRNLRNVVCASADAGGESAQSNGAGFGDDGVGDGTERAGVDEGDEDSEYRLRVVRSVVLRDRGADSEEDEEGAVCGGAVEEDVAAAEVGAEGDREDCGDELEAGVYEAELEGEVCLWKIKSVLDFCWVFGCSMHGTHVHSGALEEEGGLVGDEVSGEVLRCVDQAGDDSTAKIGALPEV